MKNYYLSKGKNFKINQRLIQITKEKDASHVNYMFKMLDMKLNPNLLQLQAIKGLGVADYFTIRGEGVIQKNVAQEDNPQINIKNIYVVLAIIKKDDAPNYNWS